MPPSLNYVQRRESNPRDALLQLYLTERNRAAVIKLNINNGNANFLIGFLAVTSTFFLLYHGVFVSLGGCPTTLSTTNFSAPLTTTTVLLIEGATFHITIHCAVKGFCNTGLI
jgi:hypothetical protein